MLQAKMVDKSKIELENIDKPVPRENEVLIKVKYAGICGSDRIMIKAESFFYAPIVMGHEVCGTIESGGKKFKKGDRVIVVPLVYCKKCDFCKNNSFNLCEELAFIGDRDYNGGFAEYIIAAEDDLFLTPEAISDEAAVLVEPTAVAYHATNLIKPESSKKVLIMGSGIIGLLAIRILKNKYNLKNITAVDIIENRLEQALKSGANKVVNLKDKEWTKKIDYKECLDDKPFRSGEYDAVIDFVSTSESTNIAISNLKKEGRLISVGLPKGDITISEISFSAISANELDIKGSYCYDKNDFDAVINMISNKTIKIEDLISAKFTLKDISLAFEEWEKNYDKWYKVLLIP